MGSDSINIEKKIKENKNKVKKIKDINKKIGNTFISVNKNLEENIIVLESVFEDCDDLVKRKMNIGINNDIKLYIMYADVVVDRHSIEESLLLPLINILREKKVSDFKNMDEYFRYAINTGLMSVDVKVENNLNVAVNSVMSGDTVIFFDKVKFFVSIQTRGWPNRGIQKADTEISLKGSKESFTETLRLNTVLIRRRIRDTNLKIKQKVIGRRSQTDVAVVYIEDVVRKDILKNVIDKLDRIDIDAIIDSSNLEEFFEQKWTLFPKVQSTERPDKAASALLEGRVVIIVDNSPYVLIVPVTLNTLFMASDDYYHSIWLGSFIRIIRYISALINVFLPGMYIAFTTFHPSMIPTSLALSIAKSREGVPFPAFLEIILMEIMFELLKEGGIRLPQPIGNTIGIVGGLIIGQAAVEANLVSPIVIIVLAVTAVASFTIPNTDLSSSFRIIKYGVIILCTLFGAYGLVMSMLILLIHLVGMNSFGVPFMSPYVSALSIGKEDFKDSVLRFPITMMKKRPVFSSSKEKIRQREKKYGSKQ